MKMMKIAALVAVVGLTACLADIEPETSEEDVAEAESELMGTPFCEWECGDGTTGKGLLIAAGDLSLACAGQAANACKDHGGVERSNVVGDDAWSGVE